MSHDDPFGAPLYPSGYGNVPPDYHPLASGDESVLAASGLNRRPDGPRKKAATVAIGVALLLGAVGIAVTAGAFGYFADKEPQAAQSSLASPVPAPEPTVESTPTPTPTPTSAAPKPKPPAPRPIAGKPAAVTRVNSGTLGTPYTVTVPTGWTIARGLRDVRTANVDVRLRNAAKTHTFSVMTIRPAVAAGPLTPATRAAIRAALLKGEAAVKPLPGTPKAQVSGSAATGYDVTTTVAGAATTLRTVVWQRGAVTYAATWRVPTALFARSLGTFGQLLASITYEA